MPDLKDEIVAIIFPDIALVKVDIDGHSYRFADHKYYITSTFKINFQIGLYIVASALFGIVLISFFLSLSSWFTVYSTYSLFGRYPR